MSRAQSTEPLEIEPFFGAFILETLTLGMYGESRNAIREYVQNAYDSINEAYEAGVLKRKEGRVSITLDDDRLVIRDNGMGLTAKSALETLVSIGASGKNYRKQAGFRGIGRLSGLVLCETLEFRTKAAGESEEVVVTFDAKGMRHQLSPARGSQRSLEKLLKTSVSAAREKSANPDEHFFEVSMQTFHEPPSECKDIDLLVSFLQQVAPVRYDDEFPHRQSIEAHARQRKSPIECVDIVVQHADSEPIDIRKGYVDTFIVGKKSVELEKIDFESSPSDYWWGWVGIKTEPGAYREEEVRAIRIRSKNIQIDGTQLMAKLFGEVESGPSFSRFNDWFVGEIFAVSDELIPNARRDGFEENEAWLNTKEELIKLCRRLGSKAYETSKKSQYSLQNLAKNAQDLEERLTRLSANEGNDKAVALAGDAIKVQRKIARATKDAPAGIAVQLRGLEARALSVHAKSILRIGSETKINATEVANKARHDLLLEIIRALRAGLSRKEFEKVVEVLEEALGELPLD